MLSRKLLLSIFNISTRSYSSKVLQSTCVPKYSTASAPGDSNVIKTASIDDVKSAKEKNVLVIDVREPSELKETGVIPDSINIPLSSIKDTLERTSPQDFKKKFGHEKPDHDGDIIFTCRSGNRSAKAYKIAEELGYTNLRNFDGGWLKWAAQSM